MTDWLGKIGTLPGRASAEAFAAANLLRAGAVGIDPPHIWLRVLASFASQGPVGAALTIAVQRHARHAALIDERGTLTFGDMDDRSTRLANSLLERGLRSGDAIGILCRNHRGFFDALFAGAKLGLRTVLLNTDFAGPQLADVCTREGVTLLVHDDEFSPAAATTKLRHGRLIAWSDGVLPPEAPTTLDTYITFGSRKALPRPRKMQHIILLTSGTTGTPKGAGREMGLSLALPGGYLEKIPLRGRRQVFVAAPMFHAWGLLSTSMAFVLGNTIVTLRKADAERTLASIEEHQCDALITVPILLSRMLAVGDDVLAAHDLSSLRVIGVSGSALPAELATRTMDRLGDIVYNLYGSTEVSFATIATPADLRAAPGCVGRPPHGIVVKLFDEHGNEVVGGRTGRVFVGSTMHFGGYTGGGTKEQINGLMSTGDIGHFDEGGRLFIDGRADDMIVSGGENVFPAEIEELLMAHKSVAEAVVIGVPDPDFGQRLRAYVVRTPRSRIGEEALKTYVRANLSRYKVPRDIVFLDQLPRNPAGKIVRRELPE